MKKILTVAIPCYNSADYMGRSIESALLGGEDVEILIIDDGSSDKTAEIADEYARKYPTIIKAIHQENKGHGGAVNTGIANAQGVFFKVLDSDDWLDDVAYAKILKILKKVVDEGHELDLLLSNYIYEKVGRRYKRVMRYKRAMPANRIISWDTCRIHFNKFQYVLMHSVIYRTELLWESKVMLPEHTFYVDNVFLFKPMIHVKKLMYVNADLYHYYIGREGQSVNEQTMVKRIDQQIFVTKELICFFSEHKDINKQMYKFLLQYLDMTMCVASIICIVSNDKETFAKKKELWKFLKKTDKKLYRQLRTTIFGVGMNLPGKPGRAFSKGGYHLFQRLFGFN